MSPSNLNNVACVIDTECTYISRTPRMVYHFGATIGNLDNDNKFDVITMDYYVKEIIENVGMFLHTNSKGNDYTYNKNMAHSWKDAINNPHKVKSWKSIIKEWKKLMKIHNVSYLTSYNFNFDLGVGDKIGTVRKTHSQLTDETFYLPRGVEHFCLMDICANLLMNKPYFNWLDNLSDDELAQMTTDKGNNKYSAESVNRFINKDLWYAEQHTAKRDSLLEYGILLYVWKKYKAIIKKNFVNDVRFVHFLDVANGTSTAEKMRKRLNKSVSSNSKQMQLKGV